MFLAGIEGLEPTQAVLETDVLPLTLYPYEKQIFIYINLYKNLLYLIINKYFNTQHNYFQQVYFNFVVNF